MTDAEYGDYINMLPVVYPNPVIWTQMEGGGNRDTLSSAPS